MGNRFATFLLLLVCSAPAFSQYVTVHAKLTDPSGTVPASAFLHIELRNCGDNFPVMNGTNTVIGQTTFDLHPTQSDGSILGSLTGNDQILCGGVASTFYHVTPMQNQTTPLGPPEDFVMCAGTGQTCYPGFGQIWELAQATPMVDPPGVPGFTFILGNPLHSQSVTQPGSGVGGAATATCCSGGAVTALNLTSPGSNFLSPPQVSFSGGGCTTPPLANAAVAGGSIVSLMLITPGIGCTSAPTVTISQGGTSLQIVGTLDLSKAFIVGLTCTFTGCGGSGGGGGSAVAPAGAVQFYTNGFLNGDPNFIWDNVVKKLTVGIPNPAAGFLTLSNTGVFTGVSTNSYLQAQINGCNPATEQAIWGAIPATVGPTSTNGLVGCLSVPASSTTSYGSAVVGFATNSAPSTQTAGLTGLARCLVNSGNCIAIQGFATDTPGLTSNLNPIGVLSSVTNQSNGSAIRAGMLFYGLWNPRAATGSNSYGLLLQAVPNVSGFQPRNGIVLDSGFSASGLDMRGTCFNNAQLAASNLNCDSQLISMRGVNAGADGNAAGFTVRGATGNLEAIVVDGAVVKACGAPKTFSQLPSCSAGNEGACAAITNSSTAVWGATITGGGGSHVQGYCDGTSWTVSAK